MVRDKWAENLEELGFYRRAAARWLIVMDNRCLGDTQLEWIAFRRGECLDKARGSTIGLRRYQAKQRYREQLRAKGY